MFSCTLSFSGVQMASQRAALLQMCLHLIKLGISKQITSDCIHPPIHCTHTLPIPILPAYPYLSLPHFRQCHGLKQGQLTNWPSSHLQSHPHKPLGTVHLRQCRAYPKSSNIRGSHPTDNSSRLPNRNFWN